MRIVLLNVLIAASAAHAAITWVSALFTDPTVAAMTRNVLKRFLTEQL